MIPQLIYFALIVAGLFIGMERHGKPKEGRYSLGTDVIATAISVALLYWGGFFDPLLARL